MAEPVPVLLFDFGDLGEENGSLLMSVSLRLLGKGRIHDDTFIVLSVNGLL